VQPTATLNPGDERPTPAVPAGEWLNARRFALVLALLIAATFPQVLLGLRSFVVRDFGFFAYPLAHFQRECFWRGELPLWNPYNNCGVPFLAQWNTMPLYPPALIYLLLPLTWSLGLFCLLHLFFAGLGMYRLAHRWSGHPLAASVAGVAFAFNGLTLNMLMWPSHIATLSWMPWVILLVEAGWQQGGRKLIVAAFAGALQMLAGGPETILLTWLLLSALWIGQAVGRWRSRRGAGSSDPLLPVLGRFPLMVLLVAALAAIQLLPFLDLAAHSQRETGYADTRWSLPGRGWANFFVPMVFGRIWNMGVFFQHHQAWTSSYYLGLGALLLACLAMFSIRRPRIWFLTAVCAIALLLAWGDQTFFYRALRSILPQLSLVTYPVKFVTLIAFSVPLLAAYGLAAWQNWIPPAGALQKRLLLFATVFLGLIAGILVWAWRAPLPADNVAATLRNGLGRAGFLVVSTGLLIALRRKQGGRWNCALPLAWIVVAWLDVLTHMPKQNPTVEPWIYTPGLARTQLAMQPQPALGGSRVMVLPTAEAGLTAFTMSNPGTNFLIKRLGYFADCNLLDDVPKVNGFFSLYPRECGELNSIIYSSTNAAFPRLADFMAASHITAADRFFDWVPREGFLPLITGGQRPIYLEDAQALQAILSRDFKPNDVVMLTPGAQFQATNQVPVRLGAARFTQRTVEFEAEAGQPSLVTVAQTFYHGWRATIDGQPARVVRANYAFQALEIPAGRHAIRMVYAEKTLPAGILISLAALIACGFLWLRKSNNMV
jgi:hypothetical protein